MYVTSARSGWAPVAILWLLLISGCGPQVFNLRDPALRAEAGSEFEGQSTVYIFWPLSEGRGRAVRVMIDGEEKGSIGRGKHIRFAVAPGTRVLKVYRSAWWGDYSAGQIAVQVPFEAGQTYFFEFVLWTGYAENEYRIAQISPAAARAQLGYSQERPSDATRSEFEEGALGPEQLLALLRSPNPFDVKRAMEILWDLPALDLAQLDAVAARLWTDRATEDKHMADAMAWLCRILGRSGNPRYQPMLLKVAADARARKVRRHAESAAEDLPEVTTDVQAW